MPEYKVELPLNHNGTMFPPGKIVTMDEDIAAPLLAVSAIVIEAPAGRPSAAEVIAKIKAVDTLEALDLLGAGDDRKSVRAAIEIRLKELFPGGAE